MNSAPTKKQDPFILKGLSILAGFSIQLIYYLPGFFLFQALPVYGYFNFITARMLHINKCIPGQQSAAFQPGGAFLQQIRGKRWIEKNKIEALARLCLTQPAQSIGLYDPGIFRTQAFSILPQTGHGFAVVFNKNTVGRATRKRLEAQHTTAGKQIQAMTARDIGL